MFSLNKTIVDDLKEAIQTKDVIKTNVLENDINAINGAKPINYRDEIKKKKSEDGYQKAKKMIRESFPSYFMLALSDASYTALGSKKVEEATRDIYDRYADSLLKYLPELLQYKLTAWSFKDRETDMVKLTLLFYAYWVQICPFWESRVRKTTKLPRQFLQEIREKIFMTIVLPPGEEDIKMVQGVEIDETFVPDFIYFFYHPLNETTDKGFQRFYGTISLLDYMLDKIDYSAEMQKKSYENFFESFCSLLYFADFPKLVTDREPREVRLKRAYQLYPNLSRCKSAADFIEEARDMMEKKASEEAPMVLSNSFFTAMCFASFGFRDSDDTSGYERLSKADRENLLLILEQCTWQRTGEDSYEHIISETYPPFYSEEIKMMEVAFCYVCYTCAKRFEQMEKERISDLLRREWREKQQNFSQKIDKDLRDRLDAAENSVHELREKNRELSDIDTDYRQKIKDLSDDNFRLRNKNAKLQSRIEALEQALREAKSNPVQEDKIEEKEGVETQEVTVEERAISSEEKLAFINECLSAHKVVMFGGSPTLRSRMEQLFPDLRIIQPDRVTNYDMLIKGSDLILLRVEYMPHLMFNNVKDNALGSGVPFDYLPDNISAERVTDGMYQVLLKHFS